MLELDFSFPYCPSIPGVAKPSFDTPVWTHRVFTGQLLDKLFQPETDSLIAFVGPEKGKFAKK